MDDKSDQQPVTMSQLSSLGAVPSDRNILQLFLLIGLTLIACFNTVKANTNDTASKQAINTVADNDVVMPAILASGEHKLPVGHQRCKRQEFTLVRQLLSLEIDSINHLSQAIFTDLSREEIVDMQKSSLARMIMSDESNRLLDPNGQPMFEVESSYLRPLNFSQLSPSMLKSMQLVLDDHHKQKRQHLHYDHPEPISVKFFASEKHDKCFIDKNKNHYVYKTVLAVGPIEHNLDVIYHLPKELRLSQPIDWRYAQIRLIVPRSLYEFSLHQDRITTNENNNNNQHDQAGCTLRVADVTYISNSSGHPKPPIAITANGLARNNQTMLNLERLFDDYTRPTILSRLKSVLNYQLSAKTLPLSM